MEPRDHQGYPQTDSPPSHLVLRRTAPPVPIARHTVAPASSLSQAAGNSPASLGTPSPEPRCKTRTLQRSSELTPRTAKGVSTFMLGAEKLAALDDPEQRTWRGLNKFVYFPEGAEGTLSEEATSTFESPACPSPGEEFDMCEVAAEREAASRPSFNSRLGIKEETYLFKSSGGRPDLASRLRSIATPGRAQARQEQQRQLPGKCATARQLAMSSTPPAVVGTIPIEVTPIPATRPSSFSQATDEMRKWLGQVERHRWDVATAMDVVSAMGAVGIREDSGCYDQVVSAMGAVGVREDSECYGQHESCYRCRGRCNCQFFESSATRMLSST